MSKHLLIIDPQNDFCHPSGALYVEGAENDMTRLAAYIIKNLESIDNITVSLDSHHPMHIAHPIWWVNEAGEHPKPFTIITKDDVENGVWKAKLNSQVEYSKEYVNKLDEQGNYALCIWPPHCLIGSEGHSVYKPLFDALVMWENKNKRVVSYLHKGDELKTESYSVFNPEVATEESRNLWDFVESEIYPEDEVIVAGEASSHCVKSSVEDLVKFCTNLDKDWVNRLTLLTDCMSPVGGLDLFKENADKFIKNVEALGGKLIKSTD